MRKDYNMNKSFESLNDSKNSKKIKKPKKNLDSKNICSKDIVTEIRKKRKCEDLFLLPVQKRKNKNIEINNGHDSKISLKEKKCKRLNTNMIGDSQEDIEEKERQKEFDKVEEISDIKVRKKIKKVVLKRLDKRLVIKDGIRYLISKQGNNFKFNLCFKEDEHMCKFGDIFVQPKQSEELKQLEKYLNEKVANQMKLKSMICHLQMKIDLYGRLMKDLDAKEEKLTLKNKLDSLQTKVNNLIKKYEGEDENEIPCSVYEENKIMTSFENKLNVKKDFSEVHKLSENFERSNVVELQSNGTKDEEEEDSYLENLSVTSKVSATCDKDASEQKCFWCQSVDHIAFYCPNKNDGIQGGTKSKCFKCNEIGHISRDCPQNSNQVASTRSCYTCGEFGHVPSDCPKISNLEGETGKSCFNYAEVGHITKECPKNFSQGGTESSCFSCNKVGHRSRDCPQKLNLVVSGSRCYICGEFGHIPKKCPEKSVLEEGTEKRNPKNTNKRKSGSGCFHCNEIGHRSRDCPQKSKTAGSGKSCYICGEFGHISKACQKKSNLGGGCEKICYFCSKSGHISRDCPNSYQTQNNRNSEGER